MKTNQYQEKGRFELAQEAKRNNQIGILRNCSNSRAWAIGRALKGCASSELEIMMKYCDFSLSDGQKLRVIRKKSLNMYGEEVITKYLDKSKVHRAWGFDFLEYVFPENRFLGNVNLAYANELSKELGIQIDETIKRECIKNIRRFALESTRMLIRRKYSSIKHILKRNKKIAIMTAIIGLSFTRGYYFSNHQSEEKLNHYKQIIENRNQQDFEAYVNDSLLESDYSEKSK